MDFKFIKGKKALVTGANGFIGSHLVKRILELGADVSIIVRENSDLWRISSELNHIDVFKYDLTESDKLDSIVEKIKPEYIFHMAAYGVDYRQKDYIKAVNSNIIGTINLLQAVSKTGCRKFLNTGTGMQYGKQEGIINEDCTLTPTTIYGSTKAASTIIAHQLALENDISISTMLPFGVFGENEGSHKFFPHIIISSLKNQDIDLSFCEQYRDYCYIENVLDGFLLAAQHDEIKNNIFNIASGEMHRLKDLVEMVFQHFDANCKPNYGVIPYRPNDLWNPQPDAGKIKELLGWTPRISIEEGIKRTVDWFKENLEYYKIQGR